jgi:hypothetical protein
MVLAELNRMETQFWAILARRVSDEMLGHPLCKQRRLWCDGLIGEHYHLDSNPRHITGVAWIDDGRRQEEWKFSLTLPRSALGVTDQTWSELALTSDVAGSFMIAPENKKIEIQLS